MKYLKAFYYLAQIGLIFVGFLLALRMLGVIMAFLTPILDSIFNWMYDNAIVGGVMLAVAFLVWWFGDECQKQVERERGR